MMWLLFCKAARNNCFISWASLRAVNALAVDERTKKCVHEPTLIKPAIDSAACVVAQAKVCRCQWFGSLQVVSRGATLIPYSAILSWRILLQHDTFCAPLDGK